MIKSQLIKLTFAIVIAVSMASCKKSNDNIDISTIEVPTVYKKIYGATSITNDGTWIYIKTKDLPDHKSVYYPTSNALYENFTGATFGGMCFLKVMITKCKALVQLIS